MLRSRMCTMGRRCTTSRPSGVAAISQLLWSSSGRSSGTGFSRRRGSLVAVQPASHCEHIAAAAPSSVSSGPRMEGTRSGESSTRSTSSCDSGLWVAMHSSAAAWSAGLSEHSRAASSASTSCGSWPSLRLSRLEGMALDWDGTRARCWRKFGLFKSRGNSRSLNI